MGNIKGVVEIGDGAMESKSFHWQVEELMKKSEMKLLPRGLKETQTEWSHKRRIPVQKE